MLHDLGLCKWRLLRLMLKLPKKTGTFRQLRDWKRSDQRMFYELELLGLIEKVDGAEDYLDQKYRLTQAGAAAADMGEIDLPPDAARAHAQVMAEFKRVPRDEVMRRQAAGRKG